MFYAVVYGESWEDVEYFSSFEKARDKLIIMSYYDDEFHPILFSYTQDPFDGTYNRCFNSLGILRRDELKQFNEVDLKMNPSAAKHLVEMIF